MLFRLPSVPKKTRVPKILFGLLEIFNLIFKKNSQSINHLLKKQQPSL